LLSGLAAAPVRLDLVLRKPVLFDEQMEGLVEREFKIRYGSEKSRLFNLSAIDVD
jgi:hypothetical protein